MRADRQIATDPQKADPTDLHRRHRREGHGAPGQTGHGVAYGQQGIGVDVRQQPERGLGFFLELPVQRRQGRL